MKQFLAIGIYLMSLNFFSQDLLNHVHTGYQGWFNSPEDNSGIGEWIHWGKWKKPLTAENLTVDMFPDLREYNPKKLYNTPLKYRDGSTVKLFSSNDYATIDLHFKWMQEYGIDGVFLQRFLAPLKRETSKTHRNKVLEHVIKAAKKYNRKVAIMYDLSGYERVEKKAGKDFKKFISKDWKSLNKKYKLTAQSCYMHENQKPVLAIWGLGFNGRPQTVRYAKDVLKLFKKRTKKYTNTYLIAGVPTGWRQLVRDSEKKLVWEKLYRSFDMLSPWSVGRYKDKKSHSNYIKSITAPDIIDTQKNKVDYMPVVFPGFSWGNLKKDNDFNSIPRKGGHFLWRQIVKAKKAGANCIYFAMFDEVDEGTAIFKVAETQAQIPTQGKFVTLDADGLRLPSDWYLQIAQEAGKVFRNEKELRTHLPLTIKPF